MKILSDKDILEAGQSSNFYKYGHNYERLHTGRAIALEAERYRTEQVVEWVSCWFDKEAGEGEDS